MICINTRTNFSVLLLNLFDFRIYVFYRLSLEVLYMNLTKISKCHERWNNSWNFVYVLSGITVQISLWLDEFLGQNIFKISGIFLSFMIILGAFYGLLRKILLEEIWNFLTILIRAFQDIIMQQRMALSRICFQARFCKERKVCGRHRRRIFFSFWCLRMAKNEWTNVESKEKGILGIQKERKQSLQL